MRVIVAILSFSILTSPAWADLDSLRAEVDIAISADESDVAIGKLRQIVELAPEDGASHYQIGSLLMDNDGDLFDAITHFEHARELAYQPMGVAYRLSRIFARTGRERDALEQVEVLAAGGFGQLNDIEEESDYDSIRENARFTTALDAIRVARFPCLADERHRAFDFWIGEWTVTQNGRFAGNNSVRPILGHCTIFEQWESAGGGFGKSFNYYDPGRDHWRQIWIDDSGSFIEFTGAARDGGIFYTAETVNPADGVVTQHKFEFTQIEDGIIRQYWETSTDSGETWAAIWDGRYERKLE